MEVSPIAVILVYMDSKGDRLLYRYPYENSKDKTAATTTTATITTAIPVVTQESTTAKKRNPYAITNLDDLLQATPPPQTVGSAAAAAAAVVAGNAGSCGAGGGHNIAAFKGQLFADEVLSALFAVKQQLCHQKFELKINDVRFVSHPTLIQRKEHRSSSVVSSASGVGGGVGIGIPCSTPQLQLQQSSSTGSVGGCGGGANAVITATSTTTPDISLTSGTATVSSGGLLQTVITTPAPTPYIKPQPQQMLINIVFALHAQASYSIVKCYYKLSKRLGLALKVEEQRVGYFTEETVQMARTHDEVSSQQQPLECAFDLISERCNLAQALKSIYHDLCTTGLLNTTLNQNLTLGFCLPQKAHQLHKKGSMVDPETIDRCLRSLKPYHGMLLLVDFAELLYCVPPSGARMLLQLIEIYTPLMSLQMLASDAELSIEHVYKLVSHLVYWGKATIIYPLCETNVYVIAPDAPLHTKSHLVEKFSTRFGGLSLFEVISDFSLPTSIGHLTTPLQQPARQGILAQMVLWMLQNHLLLQLHTYVQFMPSDLDDLGSEAGDMMKSLSLVNLNESGGSDVGGVMAGVDLIESSGNELSSIGGNKHENVGMPSSSKSGHEADDEFNPGSLLSCTSQPLPVPHTGRHSANEHHYSDDDASTNSDNILVQPSSSHKSNFSMTTSMSSDDSIASIDDEVKIKELLQVFDETVRAAIKRIPASTNVDDLSVMVKLYQAGYFESEHHLEEIMYFENLRRSQLLQLLDKFRDVLIIYETEDPAIASMYDNK